MGNSGRSSSYAGTVLKVGAVVAAVGAAAWALGVFSDPKDSPAGDDRPKRKKPSDPQPENLAVTAIKVGACVIAAGAAALVVGVFQRPTDDDDDDQRPKYSPAYDDLPKRMTPEGKLTPSDPHQPAGE